MINFQHRSSVGLVGGLLIVALLLVLTLACGRGSNPGPSEKDMYEAVKADFDALNARLSNLADSCHSGGYRHDPILAMECLGLGVGTGGTFSMSVEISNFRKVACAEAVGQPGYICDYVLNFRTNNPNIQPILARALGPSGSVTQGRFVRQDRTWVRLPMQ
jgi:hypothetical protein